MKKIMCLLVFLTVASMSMAVVAPVASVVKTDAAAVPPSTFPRKLLNSITVGADTFSSLAIGTTTQNNVLVPAMNDFDLNTAFTGFSSYVSKTVLFNGANFYSTNGSKPDFFLFEGTSGNPDACKIYPIFPDDSLGQSISLPGTLSGTGPRWGSTGLTIVGAVNNGQSITGISWDITDMKDASGAFLTSEAVIKGIVIGDTGIGLDPAGLFVAIRTPVKGEATTPIPTDRNNQVDAKTVTQVSWSAPVDPNIVSVTGYDVWLETHEPNDVTDTRKSTNQPGLSYTVSLNSATTYYWRVDTHVTWVSGPATVVKGPVWKFTTLTPTLTFKNVITTLALKPAVLSATVAGNTSPVTNVLFELLTPGATLTNTTTDNQNPTATLTTGTTVDTTYQVRLTVSGASPTPLIKVVNVKFYADACAARKDPLVLPAWTADYYDRNSDCFVALSDLQVYAQNWLNSTEMKTQESYVKAITVLELDIQVECEDAFGKNDPNYTTQAPLEENNGAPSIVSNALASGGKFINNFGSTNLLTYQVVVAQTGSYTLWFRANHEFIRHVTFSEVISVSPDGDPSNDTLSTLAAFTMNQPQGANWYLYSATPVNLTAGTHLIRITNTGATINQPWGFSPDLFGFKKNF